MDIALLGMFRVGTNYTRTVLENNYEVNVRYNSLGWKHGVIPTFASDSGFSYPDIPIVVVVKNPLATIFSWWDYYIRVGKNIRTSAKNFGDFLVSPVVFFDEWNSESPEYYFKTPIEMWNSIVWNHVSFSEKRGGYVIRYEDLLQNPEECSSKVAEFLGLWRKDNNEFYIPEKITKNMSDSSSRGEASSYLNNSKFSKKDFFLDRQFLKKYDKGMLDFARENIDAELIKKLSYEKDVFKEDEVSDAHLRLDDIGVFTLASDERLGDLANLLESASVFNIQVNIIPYNENIDKVVRLADIYDANIVEPNKKFDAIGWRIFKDSARKGRNDYAWRLFRKFNALSGGYSNVLFVDANCVFLKDVREDLSSVKRSEVVFGHPSNKGNNFTKWGEFLFSSLNLGWGAGFGADFWFIPNSEDFLDAVDGLGKFPGLKNVISHAPEQGFLNLAALSSGRSPKILEDIGSFGKYLVITKNTKEISQSESGVFYQGNSVGVAKWTGDYHNGNYVMRGGGLYGKFSEKALDRVKHDGDVFSCLSRYYENILNP